MSKQEIEYYCVISDKPHTLDENVNRKLAEGWQLHGGVSVAGVVLRPNDEKNPDIWFNYAQAMIRPLRKKSGKLVSI
jgi:Domain of unknown function (DUF1737)